MSKTYHEKKTNNREPKNNGQKRTTKSYLSLANDEDYYEDYYEDYGTTNHRGKTKNKKQRTKKNTGGLFVFSKC